MGNFALAQILKGTLVVIQHSNTVRGIPQFLIMIEFNSKKYFTLLQQPGLTSQFVSNNTVDFTKVIALLIQEVRSKSHENYEYADCRSVSAIQ